MLAEMRPDELGMWVAYYSLEPWDEQRADLRMATLCAEIHSAMGSKRKDGKPILPSDFRLYDSTEKKPVSPKQFFSRAFGHLIKKKVA